MISVVLPVYNAAEWLDECLGSVLNQTYAGDRELSVFDDSSQDTSRDIVERWRHRLEAGGWRVTTGGHREPQPRGVGYAKNRAVEQSHGEFLCFLDADDVMLPQRLEAQLQACRASPTAIVGSQFRRVPEGSTERYTGWANSLSPQQLYTQAYTSHGPTVIMPTWFCRRDVVDAAEGFSEAGKGTPEDLLFFYRHVRAGGGLVRVDEPLIIYRYHPAATTFSVLEERIWEERVREFEARVVSRWSHFTIWNAGKQGRKFFRSLSPHNQQKVAAMCDVDEKKLKLGVYECHESPVRPRPRIPVVHFSQASPPLVCCMKLGWPGAAFEKNLASLGLTEGQDYYHFN